MNLAVKCKASPTTNPTRGSRVAPMEITVMDLTPEQVGEVKREIAQYVVENFPDVEYDSRRNAPVILLYDLSSIDPSRRRELFLTLQYGVFDFLRMGWKVGMLTVVDSRRRVNVLPRRRRTGEQR